MSANWTPPPLPSRVLASRHLPLVGRNAALETMEDVWADVEKGRRQLVFLGGEPGAGKTRLVAEVAGALHDNGVVVLMGTSSTETGIPFQPFTEILDQLFTGTSPGDLDGLLDDDAFELRRLSAEVGRHLPGVDIGDIEPGELRRDLFDAVAGLFQSLAAQRPLALVLDDLHWAQLPTMALLEHVAHSSTDSRLLILVTFRTTAPDRSDEIASRVAELHRLEGVRRLDLSGLDTDAIAEYVRLRSGLPLNEARAPAALLRDRTGGNPFFLRELWADLEQRGGVAALRTPQRVPASITDTLQARIAGLGEEVRAVIELAAVLGDEFELATLVAATNADPVQTMAFVDSTMAVGLIESVDPHGGRYSFVHALTRQAVLDRMPPSRRALLHARAAEALERQPQNPALVPRLANHYLAAQVLGLHEQALRYSNEAGRLAEASLAFEDAAAWYERAASLPECTEAQRGELLLAAATNLVRASHFPRARLIFERLAMSPESGVRLQAAMGFEDATWRPGILGSHAADLLASAVEASGLDSRDPTYVRALGSLGRALTFAGETERAKQVGGRAIDLARELGDYATLMHTLNTSLWAGVAPDMADVQYARSSEVARVARDMRDYEALGPGVNFRATVSYLLGRPDDLADAIEEARLSADATGQPYYRHVFCCLAHSEAFIRGDFATAERWSEETIKHDDGFGDDLAEGPYGVQVFMIRRETGALARFQSFIDGHETFEGRWIPGLLALYTELGVELGMRRALQRLMDRELTTHGNEAQWTLELVFMIDAALALNDTDVARTLRPILATYAGKNLMAGTLIATFGSADRYLGRIAALLGDHVAAERHLETALEMDRRMHSVVHVTETLAHQARLASDRGQADRAYRLAAEARELAAAIGQQRVLTLLEHATPSSRPAGLSEREVDVLRLVAEGLSNQEIGARLHISANTAANHVRSILTKTGAANRTQAAIFAAQNDLTNGGR